MGPLSPRDVDLLRRSGDGRLPAFGGEQHPPGIQIGEQVSVPA